MLGGLSEMGNGGSGISQIAGVAVGGGVLGGIVGAIGVDLLSGAFNDENTQSYSRRGYDKDGCYQQTVTQVGGQGGRYEQV
jgi:hypothetical protein